MIRLFTLLIATVFFSVNAVAKIQVTLMPAMLKDNSGLVYVGYTVPQDIVAPYLAQLRSLAGDELFTTLRHNQAARDHDSFHITLINPYEYPEVKNIDVASLPPIRFELIGVGSASKQTNKAYFIITQALKAQKVRQRFGLKAKDLHITIGFDKTDVFGVSKGMDSLIK